MLPFGMELQNPGGQQGLVVGGGLADGELIERREDVLEQGINIGRGGGEQGVKSFNAEHPTGGVVRLGDAVGIEGELVALDERQDGLVEALTGDLA